MDKFESVDFTGLLDFKGSEVVKQTGSVLILFQLSVKNISRF